MTLAMFMLVVFTLTAMNFVQIAMGAAFGNTQEISGGYEIQANAGYAPPIPDMAAAIEDAGGIDERRVTAVGGVSNLPLEVSQEGTGRKPRSILVEGVIGVTRRVSATGFQATARSYGSDREVWEALRAGDAAIISADLAPARNASTFGPAVEAST